MTEDVRNELYDELAGSGIKYMDVTNKALTIYTADDGVHLFPLDRYKDRADLIKNVKQYFRNRT